MSASERPDLPGPWPDVLAAYVDGELEGDARIEVERWLAAHPRARDELPAQWQLSPENWRLWQKVEPPLPAEESWAAVQEAVARRIAGEGSKTAVSRDPNRKRWGKRAIFVAGGLAAAVVLSFGLAERWDPAPTQPKSGPVEMAATDPGTAAEDPLAGIETLVIARDEEVVIDRVAGDAGECLPVGEPLLSGPIVLISADELELEGAEEHPAWPTGAPQLGGSPGDAPMIFAGNPR